MAKAKKTTTTAPLPGEFDARDSGATITVPLADDLPPSVSRRVHVNGHLRGPHGAIMIRLRTALNRSHARLRDGRHVHSTPDALKWLLENIETATQ